MAFRAAWVTGENKTGEDRAVLLGPLRLALFWNAARGAISWWTARNRRSVKICVYLGGCAKQRSRVNPQPTRYLTVSFLQIYFLSICNNTIIFFTHFAFQLSVWFFYSNLIFHINCPFQACVFFIITVQIVSPSIHFHPLIISIRKIGVFSKNEERYQNM